jgi:phage I-like protein
MPFPSQHAARQRDPSGYARFRVGKLPGAPEWLSVVYGVRDDETTEIQSVRADAARVDAEEFKQWLREHGMAHRIEEATAEMDEASDQMEMTYPTAEMAARAGFTQPEPLKAPRMLAPMAAAESCEPHEVALSEDDRIEVELLRTGQHKPRMMGGRPHSGPSSLMVSEEMVDSLVRGFAAARQADHYVGGSAPVGYEHDEVAAIQDGKIDPADVKRLAAVFSEVRKRQNGDGSYSLMGSFRYTDEGREKVRAGEFRGFSLVFAPPGLASDSHGRPIDEYVPIGGTLTNRPFIRTMDPIAASEDGTIHHTQEVHTMDIKHMRGPLALSDDATEADAISALVALKEQAEKAVILSEELKSVTAERDAEREKVSALSDRDRTLTLRQAVSDGRIAKAQEDRYWRVLSALGEEEAHALFPCQNIPTQPVADVSAVPSEAASTGDDFEATMALAEKLKNEHGITDSEAFVRAWDSMTRAEA